MYLKAVQFFLLFSSLIARICAAEMVSKLILYNAITNNKNKNHKTGRKQKELKTIPV